MCDEHQEIELGSNVAGDCRHVAHDLVVYVEGHYRTIPERMSRGLAGASMGGYGAIRIAMKRPDVFSTPEVRTEKSKGRSADSGRIRCPSDFYVLSFQFRPTFFNSLLEDRDPNSDVVELSTHEHIRCRRHTDETVGSSPGARQENPSRVTFRSDQNHDCCEHLPSHPG